MYSQKPQAEPHPLQPLARFAPAGRIAPASRTHRGRNAVGERGCRTPAADRR